MALDDLGRAAALALLHEQTAFWMLKSQIMGITGPRVALWTCTALVLGWGAIRCMMRVLGVPGLGERLSLAPLYLSHMVYSKKSRGQLGVVSSRDFGGVLRGRSTMSILASFPSMSRSGRGDSLIKAIPGQVLGTDYCDLFSWYTFETHQPAALTNVFVWGADFLLRAHVSSALCVWLFFQGLTDNAVRVATP